MQSAIQIQTTDFYLDEENQLANEIAPNCGAVMAFIGKVRGNDHQAALSHLYLEHFPQVTEAEIQKIIDEAAKRWSLSYVKVIHRIGHLYVGNNIVLVLTASGHRKDAYEANAFIMDYLKTEAPFWKKEIFENGDAQWVEMKQSDLDKKKIWDSHHDH